jgi:zinc/manganese transport system permease protein
MIDSVSPTVSDQLAVLGGIFAYPFMVNAFEAGTVVAVMAAVVGWFVVLRRQAFAAHTLSVMAFPGAAAAMLAGVAAPIGYFAFSTVGALALSASPRSKLHRYSEQSAAIGVTQALALAAGFVFVSLYGGVLNDLESLLFGTVLGITQDQVLVLLVVCLGVVALASVAGRLLLFASVDPQIAGARGIPVRALEIGFLVVVALAVSATSQIIGVLLVFALLVTPAATAQQLVRSPSGSLMCAIALALVVTWAGLALAYFTVYPVGFYVTSISFGLYLLAVLRRHLGQKRGFSDKHPKPAGAERTA